MPTEQDQYEQIERYLSGQMTGAELEAFEAALRKTPALAEAFALHQAMEGSLGNPRRRQLLDALHDVVEAPAGPAPGRGIWLWVAAAALVLLLLLFVGRWWKPAPPAGPPPAAQEQPSPTRPETPAPEQPVAGEADSPRPETPRIAAANPANFAPNRALDPLAGTLVRGAGDPLEIRSPAADRNFRRQNGQVGLAVEGRAPGRTALLLQIFNNREADFLAGKSVFRTEVPVQEGNFSWVKALRLAPGRYYVVLTEPGEEEPAAVARFYVEKGK
jgi:anti-sigma factor RsiW